jgi:hypothetical protein
LYQTLWNDKRLLTVALLVVLIALARGGGLAYIADELRFYLAPVAFYLLGRVARPFQSDRRIARFVIFVAALYVAVGFLFVILDRNWLLDYGLRDFFHQKMQDLGREDEIFNGLPINFYFFREGGKEISRAFGAFFDPLVTAFFGAAVFFYIAETYRRMRTVFTGALTALVGLMLLLTLTRAIILIVILVILISSVTRRGIASLPLWVALVAVGLAVLAIALNMDALIQSLDPSSVGHLDAYLSIGPTTGVLGAPPDPGAPRGSESLYLTAFLEMGAIVFIAYALWIGSLYAKLRRHYGQPYTRPALESMFIYLLASFTTEHWFVFTSGAFFWLLLGDVLGIVEHGANSDAMTGKSDLSPLQPIKI